MEESPKALADELEQTANALEKRGEAVEKNIATVRTEAERRRAESPVAGAAPEGDEEQGAAVESPIPDDVVDPDDAPPAGE